MFAERKGERGWKVVGGIDDVTRADQLHGKELWMHALKDGYVISRKVKLCGCFMSAGERVKEVFKSILCFISA